MTTYTIQNTAGSTVATINPATTTGTAFSVEMPGQGYSLYGQAVNQSMYRMMENSANTTAPTNPVVGQWWYNTAVGSPFFWNGSAWIIVAGSRTTMILFTMASGAFNIDFTSTGLTTIFTHPGGAIKYFPTGLLLQPAGFVNVTGSPVFSLQNLASEDVMEANSITAPTATKFAWWSIEGLTEPVTAGNSVSINVSAAATGGVGLTLRYNAFLFGWLH